MSDSDRFDRFAGRVQGHYGYVLAALLIIFAIQPFTVEHGWVALLLEGAYFVTIFTCLMVSLGKRTWRALLFAAVTVESLAFVARLTDVSILETPGRILRVMVLFIVMFAVLRDVVRSKTVTMNTVFAASSVYLLMALGWGSIFIVLEALIPGSFKLTQATGHHVMDADAQLVYFSMITLTTVGYGDITPLSPQARSLSALEGLIGQLYVAIIIARFVALEIVARRIQDEKDES